MRNVTQQLLKICLVILFFLSHSILGGPDQRNLLKHLFIEKQHDPLERPVLNDTHTLPVSINLALQQIINYDGKNEVIIISGWLVLMWKDYSLTWNASEYGNIQTIRVPTDKIWTPDILLYNSADEKFDSTMRVNAVVQHTGDILYVPPGIFKSICPFDIATFPFVRINLTAENDKGQLDAYIKSAEWDLEDFSAINNALKYDCCPNLYPFVLYTIRIRRRSLYYFTNIVVPCFLISCMTILGFLLAPDSGEKLTLQITILLSVVMFSLLMSEIMPPSSSAIPIITKYFMCVMLMSTLSVVASVLVISLHFRNDKNYTMPVWVRKYICNYLAWLLCMKRPKHDLTWRAIRRRWAAPNRERNSINKPISNHHHHHKSPAKPLLRDDFESLSNNEINIHVESLPFPGDRKEYRSDSMLERPVSKIQRSRHYPDLSRVVHPSCDTEMIRSELRVIISQLAFLVDHTRQQGEHEDEAQDWKFVAMVIDRLCLIIFIISMAVFTLLTLFSAPNFLKLT